ncbi:DUF3693 domain-containing protein [Xanthomonas translucens pv. translucens]|nr:DUF3693 domain-containing protein [Xanthomonas translucens]MCS3360666.1 DUF3693 domain-containing protein [Xanthomonas translucens pv. translucens]MCS3373302.1 DUF3693 domain-containing protein [Xanthomonas translucens pv. translucens]MCT8290243.1 DUF3693 domain-containing protein [Xanthomonas translucens pv. translucens]MCT8293925.1 DUF3693 domain-containing protein [Xanthomonas translucens pv. translucens]MCT8312361.1 DUF3693 domain-containing protein [Xanthomonas translucens pv. transluc
MGITSGVLSEWKKGNKPIPDERIQQLAKIAGQDIGPWLLLIRSEQDQGELGREWAKLYKRLGATAAVFLCVIGLAGNPTPAIASERSAAESVYYVRIGADWVRQGHVLASAACWHAAASRCHDQTSINSIRVTDRWFAHPYLILPLTFGLWCTQLARHVTALAPAAQRQAQAVYVACSGGGVHRQGAEGGTTAVRG